MDKHFKVTKNTSADELASIFKRDSTMHSICWMQNITRNQLINIAKENANKTHCIPLYQQIVLHPAATSSLCELLLNLSNWNVDVANAIITSRKASRRLLNLLATKQGSESVRGHATLALIEMETDKLSSNQYEDLIKKHSGDKGIALGVRYLLASKNTTPLSALCKLSTDEADFIAQTALKTIARIHGDN